MNARILIPAMLLTASGFTLPLIGAPAPVSMPRDLGPDIVMLDQLPGCYGAVRFDHRLHVGMSAIGDSCSSCHHTGAIESCRSCHSAQPTPIAQDTLGLRGAYHQQCLGCHKDWAHENACGFCHAPSESLESTTGRASMVERAHQLHTPPQPTYVYQTAHKGMPVVTFHHADHAKVFGLSCTDCHAGSTCGQCHGNGATRPVVMRQQSCYRCHAESNCSTCHHVTQRPPFDHAQCANWRLRPGHDTLACAQCHGTEGMPTRPTSSACLSCHAEQNGGTFDHAVTGVVLNGNHSHYSCLDCHTGGDDRRIARCTACHEDRQVAGWREVGRRGPRAATN